jgi:uncharacterized membrane protein
MKFFKQFDLRRQQKIAWGLLILAIIIYALAMGYESVLRYLTFKATAFDLGNMDQVLWNTIHGRPFQFTNQAIDWYGPPTRLAVHVEPIMLVISLLYVFHADPRILLIFQTLVLVAGAPAVFLLSRRYLPSWPLLATVISVAYLASPALMGINIFDFHPDCVATPLFLYAILAVTYRRYIWFLILCVGACACKEDMPLAVAFLGILLIWKYQLPRLGLTLLSGGLLWTYIAFKVVIPHFYTGVLANNFWYRYETLGSTPAAAIINLLIRPWLIFTQVVTLDRVYYIFSLLRSTGFLALLAPEWLLPTLPKLASNILSDNQPNYSGVYHYNAAIIPFVMLAAIHGIRRLIFLWQGWSKKPIRQEEIELLTGKPAPDTESKPYPVQWIPTGIKALSLRAWEPLAHFFKRIRPRLARITLPTWRRAQWESFSARMFPLTKTLSTFRLQWVLCIWIIFALGLNYALALPQLNSFWADHLPGTREQQIQQLLDLIPPDASVSASDDLNPHLSERQWLQVYPATCLDRTCDHVVDYIIVDLNNPTIGGNRADAINELNSLEKKQYRLIKQEGNVVLLQRRGT